MRFFFIFNPMLKFAYIGFYLSSALYVGVDSLEGSLVEKETTEQYEKSNVDNLNFINEVNLLSCYLPFIIVEVADSHPAVITLPQTECVKEHTSYRRARDGLTRKVYRSL